MVGSLKAYMKELVGRNIPFERKERLTSDVIKIFEKQGLHDKVKLLRTTHELYTVYYRLDGVCDSYYGTLPRLRGCVPYLTLYYIRRASCLWGLTAIIRRWPHRR